MISYQRTDVIAVPQPGLVIVSAARGTQYVTTSRRDTDGAPPAPPLVFVHANCITGSYELRRLSAEIRNV